MPSTANTPSRILGCDVGKAAIVVFDSRDGTTCTIANQPDALAAFAAGLVHHQVQFAAAVTDIRGLQAQPCTLQFRARRRFDPRAAGAAVQWRISGQRPRRPPWARARHR